MKIDKTTIIVIASAASCTLSAVGSIITSINARRNPVTVINTPKPDSVDRTTEDVVYEQMQVLKDLPLKDRLLGLEALKNGHLDTFLFHLKTD